MTTRYTNKCNKKTSKSTQHLPQRKLNQKSGRVYAQVHIIRIAHTYVLIALVNEPKILKHTILWQHCFRPISHMCFTSVNISLLFQTTLLTRTTKHTFNRSWPLSRMKVNRKLGIIYQRVSSIRIAQSFCAKPFCKAIHYFQIEMKYMSHYFLSYFSSWKYGRSDPKCACYCSRSASRYSSDSISKNGNHYFNST